MSGLTERIAMMVDVTPAIVTAEEILQLVKEECIKAIDANATRLSIYEKEDGIYADKYGSYIEYRLAVKAINQL